MTNEVAGIDFTKKNVLICDTQPVAVEGMKWLIENSGDLHFTGSVPTLQAVFNLLNPEAAKLEAERAAAEAAALELAAAELAALDLAELKASVAELESSDAPMQELAAGELEASANFCGAHEALGLEAPEVQALGVQALGVETSEKEALATAPLTAEVLENEPPIIGGAAWEQSETDYPALESCAAELPRTDTPAILDDVAAVLEAAVECEPIPPAEPIDVVVIDKGLGIAGVMELLQKLTSTSHPTPMVVWGAAISEAEALRLLQAGARGILRRTSESGTLLTCLRAVTAGGTWMEDGIFGSTEKLFNPRRSELTHREREVVVLVEKGLRNRDIARLLGIQTGTVKIHLKHIFEKTGVRGRYGLAFTGLQSKGSIAMTAPAHFTA